MSISGAFSRTNIINMLLTNSQNKMMKEPCQGLFYDNNRLDFEELSLTLNITLNVKKKASGHNQAHCMFFSNP